MRRLKRFATAIFFAISALYGFALTLILGLRWFVGERWMVIALANSTLHLLLLPALVLLPLCLLARRWRTALLVAPVFWLFILSYGVFFLPRPVTDVENAPRLRILTYNLHAEQKVLDPMVELIRAAKADVVVMQEMSAAAAARLEAELKALYPYRALHPDPNPYHGRGLLSRYPVAEDQSWPVEYPIPIRLQRVELDFRDKPLVVYNFHAPPTVPIWGGPYDVGPRARQINDLLDMAGQENGLVLLAGDFNTVDLDENYAHITAHFQDSFREAGWGFGFTNPDWSHDWSREGPAFVPLYQRIDYVFHDDHFQAVEARVWPESGGSDHRPLYVTLALLTD